MPMELVRECLEIALQAPTGGNSQGWHWLVVTDPELRAQIGEYYRRSFAAYRESRLRGPVGGRGPAAGAGPGGQLGGLAGRADGPGPGARHRLPDRGRRAAGAATRPGCGARCCRPRGATSSRPGPAGWAARGPRCT